MVNPKFIPVKLDEKEIDLLIEKLQGKITPIEAHPFQFTWITQDGLEELQGPKTVTITLGENTNRPSGACEQDH